MNQRFFHVCLFVCNKVTVRIFHTGKVIFLGVKHVSNIVEPFNILSSTFFDYWLQRDLNIV